MSVTKRPKTKRRRKNRQRLAGSVILIAAVCVFAISCWKLITIFLDYHLAESSYTTLIDDVVSIPEEATDDSTEEELAAWALVTIDFDSLTAINTDVIGWIRFDDTDAVNVDYPILQGETNNTYLRTNLYGEKYSAGSIFLESANTADFSDYYNIIYGHNMKNASMFGTLKKYKNEDGFYEENQYFTIYTEAAAYRYQIFAYEVVTTASDVYTIGYAPDIIYENFITSLLAASLKDTGITPTNTDRIVTLSTCTSSGDNDRFVVHAVRIDQYIYD